MAMEDDGHESLEGGWGVGKSERHDPVLELTKVGHERSFLSILRGHLHLVVSHEQVKGREELGTRQRIQSLVQAW